MVRRLPPWLLVSLLLLPAAQAVGQVNRPAARTSAWVVVDLAYMA